MVEWATLAVTVLGLGGILLQIRAAASAQERDHQRQKRQATLDAWHDPAAVQQREAWWALLPDERDVTATRAACPMPTEVDHPLYRPVVSYLNYLEDIAVGVHVNVFDLRTLDALAGGRFICAWRAYEPFIHGRRELVRSRTLWISLERLAADLDSLGPTGQVPSDGLYGQGG